MVITFASGLEPKWFISIALALICLSVSPLIREKEKFILYVSVLVLPISLDFFLIHFENLPYSLPISGLRFSAFDICFFFLLISWAVRLASVRNIQIRLYPYVSIPFALLFIIFLLASLSSPIPSIIKLSYTWYFIKSWLIFIYIANNVQDRRTVFVIVSLFLISGVIQSFLAIAQYATGGTLGLDLFGESGKGYFAMKAGADTVNRVAGTLGHPNTLGMFLGMWLPVNLALIFAPISKRFKCMLIPSMVLISIAHTLTFSRGAWLSLSIGGSITLYWCILKRTKNKILSGFLTTTILIIFIASAVTLVEPVQQRLFKYDYGSASMRIPLAKLALNMIQHNPFIGVGPGSFHAVAHKYDTTREGISYSFQDPVHNTFLLITAELGIPALGITLIIIGYIFVNILRTANSRDDPVISYLGVGFFGAWLVWTIHQLVDYEYIFLFSSFWFNLALILVITQFATKKLPLKVKSISKSQQNTVRKEITQYPPKSISEY